MAPITGSLRPSQGSKIPRQNQRAAGRLKSFNYNYDREKMSSRGRSWFDRPEIRSHELQKINFVT